MLARRTVIRGLAAGGVAGSTLATVLADPRLARAAAESLETVTLETPMGQSVSAALARPERSPAPAVLLIHEWWGLNDQIKSVAAEFAREGFVALAVDLYSGNVATSRAEAQAYMRTVRDEEALDTLGAWIDWLRRNQAVRGGIGTVGWCFGGGWSLRASVAVPVEATVVYYGRVNLPFEQLESLRGPVLGHFATEDKWINEVMVAEFEKQMAAAGKTLDVHWYEADHAFANPTSARHDAADARQAWARTLAFLRDTLG